MMRALLFVGEGLFAYAGSFARFPSFAGLGGWLVQAILVAACNRLACACVQRVTRSGVAGARVASVSKALRGRQLVGGSDAISRWPDVSYFLLARPLQMHRLAVAATLPLVTRALAASD